MSRYEVIAVPAKTVKWKTEDAAWLDEAIWMLKVSASELTIFVRAAGERDTPHLNMINGFLHSYAQSRRKKRKKK